LVALLAATGIGLSAALAQARTFEVTRRNDPAPGQCRAHDCSLREAVMAANDRPGADVVELVGGRRHFLQRAPSDPSDPATGDLEVTDELVVRSDSASQARINGGGTDRIFEVTDGEGLTLEKLHLLEGVTEESGGAVYVDTNCKLRVDRSTVVDNEADYDGGGIAANTGMPVRVTRSKFNHNRANLVGADSGGGGFWADDGGTFKNVKFLHNSAGQGGGLLTYDAASFTHVKLLANRATDVGGALFLYDYDMPIRHANISGNKAKGEGGGIYSAGAQVDMRASTVINNEAGTGIAGTGGGIHATSGTLLVRESSVMENTAHGFGGGIHLEDGVDGRIEASALWYNAAVDGYGGGGMAVRDAGTAATVENSTLWSNRAFGYGGGIETLLDGATTLTNSTVVSNRANWDHAGGETGGGLGNGAGTVTLANSLVAHNHAAGGPGADCGGAVDSEGVNLVQDTSGCTGVTDPPDITGVNPLTRPLHENGGPTKTVAIRRSSPARNAAGAGSTAEDQRGVPRHNPDIGAFEFTG